MRYDPEFRLRWLGRLGCLVFGILVLGLVYLQILRGAHFRTLAQRNAFRVMPVEAPRGIILDRFGRPLATNRLSLDIAVIPQDVPDLEFVLTQLAELSDQPLQQLRRNFARNRSLPFVPVVLIADAAFEHVVTVEERRHELPGIVVLPRAKRMYPYGPVAAHVLGFIGPVDRAELRRLRQYGVRLTDWIGKSGIEAQYEAYLRGEDGGMVVEVDSRGRQMQVISRRDPTPGQVVVLTLDAELQRLIEIQFQGRAGACVVLQPETGDVLALVSSPTFDPSIFLSTDRQAAVETLHDEGRPLTNRAISGEYPPGSIFKIITAVAALEERQITPETTYNCAGAFQLGRRAFRCWKRDGHGPEAIRHALRDSCNVFFFNTGLAVGPDPLTLWAGLFGLGLRAGIDLPGERPGLVPSRAWKRQHLREHWYDGDTANFSIGQGHLLVTPLQAARALAAVANGGWLIEPHLVQRIGAVLMRTPSAHGTGVAPATRQVVVEGLIDVVAAPGGTGRRASQPGVSLAGKTGTAQTGRPEESHAWMVGFTPVDQPRAAFAVVYEFGGSGGYLPALLVQRITAYIQQHYGDTTATSSAL